MHWDSLWFYAARRRFMLRGSQVQPVFQQGDTLILLDGRSPSTFEVLSKELGKVLRAPAVASTLPARKWIVIRRFFRNAEFERNGYASKARRQNLKPIAAGSS